MNIGTGKIDETVLALLYRRLLIQRQSNAR